MRRVSVLLNLLSFGYPFVCFLILLLKCKKFNFLQKSLRLKDPILHDKVAEKDDELRKLYRQSILENGHVNVVNGQQLQSYHQVANYVHDNPIKVLGGIGVPAVAMIFYGNNGKAHLNLQMKLLHTRVIGQFAVLCTLLSVMTIKEIMDRK